MSTEGRERWFTTLLDVGLEQKIFEPKDVLVHVTPEVLSAHLPADLMSKVLQSALSAGCMTPESVLETVSCEVLSAHIPHGVLWALVTTAVERAEIPGTSASVGAGSFDTRRKFLHLALDCGLDQHQLEPPDVLNHLTPALLAEFLPVEQKATLLTEALAADAMNPHLVVKVIGPQVLATHLPMSALWSCLHEAGTRALTGGDSPSGRLPAARVASTEPELQAPRAATSPGATLATPGLAPVKPVKSAAAAVRPATASASSRIATGKLGAPKVGATTPNVAPSKGPAGKPESALRPSPRHAATHSRRGEFDEDTNVGANDRWSESQDDFELVEEADAISVDWPSEETDSISITTEPPVKI